MATLRVDQPDVLVGLCDEGLPAAEEALRDLELDIYADCPVTVALFADL